jgi:hypothetical protein
VRRADARSCTTARDVPIALTLLIVVVASCGVAPSSCASRSGGEPDAIVQLRHISFGVDQVSLLFVQRPDAPYGVPAHTIEGRPGVVRIQIAGARLRNPDGTPSYVDDRPLPPGGRMRDLRVREEPDGSIVAEIDVTGASCAMVTSRRSGLGSTFSAALVGVSLVDGPVVALDPDRGRAGSPMQVVGVGLPRSTAVEFHSGDRMVWESRSDERGLLDTVIRVPDLPAGDRTMLVRAGVHAIEVLYRIE